ncbi:MAG: hypothetical protein COZ05_22605 [Armatimonadetes bacterium CG_4_10_14_3_um_filter_59_10]|nr:MAG: hypothetical protein COZ56_07610 [Armatimonadetes bacterium CG_4_8_14_3_um_filter_58_9]PIY37324.1 MAG: hypothetical protein COZ05_22605 [Armatimonadetes bacterium CG_4_10_14_3_um_filter_59_10]PJB78775.1 MAG: hypothetical protein CO095_00135 [Armatimonadetes bacterium CG_4_9_14_3_um_filter_58_7]
MKRKVKQLCRKALAPLLREMRPILAEQRSVTDKVEQTVFASHYRAPIDHGLPLPHIPGVGFHSFIQSACAA